MLKRLRRTEVRPVQLLQLISTVRVTGRRSDELRLIELQVEVGRSSVDRSSGLHLVDLQLARSIVKVGGNVRRGKTATCIEGFCWIREKTRSTVRKSLGVIGGMRLELTVESVLRERILWNYVCGEAYRNGRSEGSRVWDESGHDV